MFTPIFMTDKEIDSNPERRRRFDWSTKFKQEMVDMINVDTHDCMLANAIFNQIFFEETEFLGLRNKPIYARTALIEATKCLMEAEKNNDLDGMEQYILNYIYECYFRYRRKDFASSKDYKEFTQLFEKGGQENE